MASHDPLPNDDRQTTLAGLGPRLFVVLAVVGGVALTVAVALGLSGREDGLRYFFHSYLINFCFVASLSLGALCFVAIQHVTRSGWSVTIRRVAEILAANFPVVLVLLLPIVVPVLLGSHALYEWSDPEAAAQDPLIAGKAPYLNAPFFGIRCVIYFAVWLALGRFYLTRSLEQDTGGEPALTLRMERASPVALLLLAVTITFAAFDWLMSLDPHWFSTIFGVYYFSGAILGTLALMVVIFAAVQATGQLGDQINVEHYHDLGKLLLGFVIFWGYIAFSQYMLIWYANIPEETEWYIVRQTGGWEYVTLALLFGHLLIPFFALLSRHAKRHKPTLVFWAAWLLVMHWIDLYWLVMPSLSPDRPPLAVLDVFCAVGVIGLYLAGAVRVAGQKSLVPLKDPRLGEALAFENL